MIRSPLTAALLATTLVTGPVARAQEAGPGTVPLSGEDRQEQLNRIEAKLDTLLNRLGDATDASGTPDPAGDPSTAVLDPATSPEAGTEAPAEAESYMPGAIAVAHAAPTRGQPLGEIPADSIGGFVYTGGPIRLDDLADRGVRYAGSAGIELQGWLRATETGRHQIAADLQVRFGTGAIASLPCTFAGWLEGQAIGAETREADPWGAKGEPVPLSLVLGVELEPGLYRLRLWIACADLPTARDGLGRPGGGAREGPRGHEPAADHRRGSVEQGVKSRGLAASWVQKPLNLDTVIHCTFRLG